jgi:hypothetical protein
MYIYKEKLKRSKLVLPGTISNFMAPFQIIPRFFFKFTGDNTSNYLP